MKIIVMAVAAPVYSRPDNSAIDCIITCQHGQLPFTATAHDPMEHGQLLYADLVAGKYGPIAPFAAKS